MNPQLALDDELRRLVEKRMQQTLEGIEDTLGRILEHQELSNKDLTTVIQSLETSFALLSQKWTLEIVYTLFLRTNFGFSGLKKTLSVNSRTLSDKLKTLKEHGYIERNVEAGPPLKVRYSLTTKGKNTVLLALPLLYYSAA